MSSDSREEVERILNDGFADREDELNRLDMFGPKGYDHILSDDCWGVFSEHQAHLAVHVNDIRHRGAMRETVITRLLCGNSLYPADRAWLIYVLGKLDDIPCESKNGHPIDGDGEIFLKMKLAAFLIDDEIKNPGTKRGYIKARLNRAADAICKSYEVVRKIYYDDSFKKLLENLKERGFNPLRDK